MTQDAVTNPKGSVRTLILATLASNFAIGLPLGSFGVSVLAIEDEFHTTRALASTAGALIILAYGLMAPVCAFLMERFTIRATMITGVVLGSVGYVALWAAPNIWTLLAVFALLIGPGSLLAGNFPSSVLINNWFRVRTGRAVGIMMMPLFVMLVPLASNPIIEGFGLRTLYLVLGAVNLLILPLLMLVEDRPADVEPCSRSVEAVGSISPPVPRLTTGQILGRISFWLLILASGTLNGSGMVKLSHLVPLVAEQGRSMGEATFLLSVSGGAGIFGSFAFGWLADRLGGARSLMLNALLQAATWSIFFLHPGLPLLYLDAFLMGMCGGGVFAAYMILNVELFGRENIPRVLGLAGLFGMIPSFIAPPIAGYLYDLEGSYWLVLIAMSSACLTIAVAMAGLSMWPRRISIRFLGA